MPGLVVVTYENQHRKDGSLTGYPGTRRRQARRTLTMPGLVALLTWFAAVPAAAQQTWTLRAGYELARPTGWVQVRENAIAGTRLSLGRDLGVRLAATFGIQLGVPAGGGVVGVRIAGTALRGSTRLARDVDFNGSTLQAGTVLRTRTSPTDFLRIVLDYERTLARVGAHGSVWGRAGLDATLLEFRLQGTLSPTTVGHETKEDFVTQELPTPFVGAGLRLPLGSRVRLRLGADGGALPWVSSLRYEGGLVRLRQNRWDADAGLQLAIATRWSAGVVLHYTSFTQDEQSREDGNQFHMAAAGARLQLSWGSPFTDRPAFHP